MGQIISLEHMEKGLVASLLIAVPLAFSLGGRSLHGASWRSAQRSQLSTRHRLLCFLCFLLYAAPLLSLAIAPSHLLHHLRPLASASLLCSSVMCASALATFPDSPSSPHHPLSARPSQSPSSSPRSSSSHRRSHSADLHLLDSSSLEHPVPRRNRSDTALHSLDSSAHPPSFNLTIRRVGTLTAETAAAVIVVMCFLLALVGAANVVAFALEIACDLPSRVVNCSIAFICIALSVPLTHGVGGSLKHSSSDSGWRFIQPFNGGVRFVAVQTISWALFGLSMAGFSSQFTLLALMAFAPRARVFAGFVPRIAIWSGIAGLLSEILVAVSLSCFEPPYKIQQQRQQLSRRSSEVDFNKQGGRVTSRLFEALNTWLVLSMMYSTPQLAMMLVSLIAGVLRPTACAIIFGTSATAYTLTYRGRPEATGKRTWPAFRSWLSRWSEKALTKWCGGVTIIKDTDYEFDPQTPHVIGFHPHGMYPVSASWLALTESWRRMFPNINPITLGATAMFRAPLVREPLMWAGVREVSRSSFRNALKTNKSVLLCPGGQQELFAHTGTTLPVILCTRHSGFVRMAIEEGAKLVPMLSFSEAITFSNALSLKRIQRATYRRLGFPVPHIPGGYLGFTPLPKRIPQVFVVGNPIEVPPRHDDSEAARCKQVEQVKVRYYTEIERLFDAHKDSLGYDDAKLKYDGER